MDTVRASILYGVLHTYVLAHTIETLVGLWICPRRFSWLLGTMGWIYSIFTVYGLVQALDDDVSICG